MPKMPVGGGRALGALVVAASACGGGGGGGGTTSFAPTTPVPDACAMLALATVQTVLPAATDGSALPPDDTADVWTRGCAWEPGGPAVTLLVEGALTHTGALVLQTEVDAHSSGTTQATAVSGVGDQAAYLVNQGLGQILNARKANTVVSVGASNFTTAVSESSLQPLAVEALGKL